MEFNVDKNKARRLIYLIVRHYDLMEHTCGRYYDEMFELLIEEGLAYSSYVIEPADKTIKFGNLGMQMMALIEWAGYIEDECLKGA